MLHRQFLSEALFEVSQRRPEVTEVKGIVYGSACEYMAIEEHHL